MKPMSMEMTFDVSGLDAVELFTKIGEKMTDYVYVVSGPSEIESLVFDKDEGELHLSLVERK